ncbi:MAG: ABC transporter ATP-binding protein [Armatimonadota bacterium]
MPDKILEIIGLTKDFRRRRAVDGLDLTVYEGDIYGFLGPNGAGKSTTIRMLTGLVRPNHGTARLLGMDVRAHGTEALRNVGALVETPTFYKYMSARENLKIFSQLSGGCTAKRIDQVLDITGLADRADDKVRTYSQGMRQRLGIAQALIPNPKLIILDEPTNGLDPQGMKDVRELILHLAREEKMTVFLSSHLLHEVEQICSRVGIIKRGRLVAEGCVQDLLTKDTGIVDFSVSDTQAAISIINSIDSLEVVTHTPGSVSVRISEDRIAGLNRTLVTGNVEVSTVIPRTSSLEELFLNLIGEDENAD